MSIALENGKNGPRISPKHHKNQDTETWKNTPEKVILLIWYQKLLAVEDFPVRNPAMKWKARSSEIPRMSLYQRKPYSIWRPETRYPWTL